MRNRQVSGVGTVVGLALALVTACAAKKPAPFPDVASFCSSKAQAECQVASTCLIDTTDCEAQRASLCNTDAMQAMASGTRKYTQANAQPCIDAVTSAYGNGHTSVTYAQLVGPGSLTDVCERVFSGNASMDEACQSSYDCTGSLVCAPAMPGTFADGGSGSLVCAPVVQVPEGQFCATPGSTCAADTYCALPATGSAYECQPAMTIGQPCSSTAPCVSTARCETSSGVTGQTCAARAKLGEACQTSEDCDPSAPYCDPYLSNRCTTGLSFASGAPDCMAFTSAASAAPAVADDGGAD
jgi:hypothetical protein